MNLGKRLYELQQLDLHLERTAEMLSQIDHQLNHNEALSQARTELQAIQKDLAALHEKQRSAEWVVDDLQAKLKPIQQKLFAGSVSNPKELTNLQQQASQLKSRISEEEDRILDIMSQAEAFQKTAATKSALVASLEHEWAEKRNRLLEEQVELQATAESSKRKRDEILSQLDPAHIQLYERLRQMKHGNAVAKIEQGRCQGCKITVPVSELTKARAGELVQCSSCNRLMCIL